MCSGLYSHMQVVSAFYFLVNSSSSLRSSNKAIYFSFSRNCSFYEKINSSS